MSKPDKDSKRSERDLLNERLKRARQEKDCEQVARCLRRLRGAPLPAAGRHVWAWFCELSTSRTAGMAANPLSFLEIAAWSRLTGVRPTPQEIRLIKALDRTWLEVQTEEKDPSEPPRNADGEIDYDAVEDGIMAAFGS